MSRSLSMSSLGSGDAWLSLLDEKRSEILECFGRGIISASDISSGRSFRRAFEAFCRKKGEHRSSRLEAKLLPSFTPITELARAVGLSAPELKHLAPAETPEGLIWWASFGLFERGCRAGAELGPLVTLVADFNQKVPRFSNNDGRFDLRFPNDERVQKPLQEVYSLFIDSYLFFVSYLKESETLSSDDLATEKPLASHIAEAAGRLEEARGRYDVLVSQVAEDEERKRADIEQPSLDAQRTLPDYSHQNGTSIREVQVRWVSQRSLGHGSYGHVDEVRELSTGVSYARKHIHHLDSGKPSSTVANEVENEVRIMQKLRHLHIATVLFYFKDEEAYSIFMLPVADYDLRRFLTICTKEDFPPGRTKQIYPWFGCLLDALAYAHKLEIKHQDIKPSNILIKNNQPYLCDFGLAKDFSETGRSSSDGPQVHGTFVYHAPEVLPGKSRGRKADVFALGCVYSEMLTVTQGKSLEDYREAREVAASMAFRESLPVVEKWMNAFERSKLDDLLVDEILDMINKNADRRHSAAQALNSLKRERALFCVE